MFNPYTIRKDFPLLERKINGKPITYLDSAATSLKPKPVLDAMWKYYTEYSANIHRGIYQLSEEATAAYDQSRKEVAQFIGSRRVEEVIFTRNTTEALNLVASAWGRSNVGGGDSIVSTMLEHHANFVPWQQLAHDKGAIFLALPITKEGKIEQGELNKYITRTTKIFAFSAASNVMGVVCDVPAIVAHVRKLSPSCLVVVDAAQAIPHCPVDVAEWNADFVAFSGHKILGPTGIGVLWGRLEILDQMPPYQFGGDMIKDVRVNETFFAPVPQKFEAGTPDIAQAIGLGAAVSYIKHLGMENVRSHEHKMVSYAFEKLQKMKGLTIFGPKNPNERGSVIAFGLDVAHAHDIAQVLSEDNICIRAGHHCAMPLHTFLGLKATARASVYVYTIKEDIDALIEGLEKVRKIFT